ncbi:MAG: hypothetical protein N3A38_00340 [Planctomycetota bacterium]|nr:hypothetical protein [Planctomycetota bacterium]
MEIIFCSKCGLRIPHADIEAGRAVPDDAGRRICPSCRQVAAASETQPAAAQAKAGPSRTTPGAGQPGPSGAAGAPPRISAGHLATATGPGRLATGVQKASGRGRPAAQAAEIQKADAGRQSGRPASGAEWRPKWLAPAGIAIGALAGIGIGAALLLPSSKAGSAAQPAVANAPAKGSRVVVLQIEEPRNAGRPSKNPDAGTTKARSDGSEPAPMFPPLPPPETTQREEESLKAAREELSRLMGDEASEPAEKLKKVRLLIAMNAGTPVAGEAALYARKLEEIITSRAASGGHTGAGQTPSPGGTGGGPAEAGAKGDPTVGDPGKTTTPGPERRDNQPRQAEAPTQPPAEPGKAGTKEPPAGGAEGSGRRLFALSSIGDRVPAQGYSGAMKIEAKGGELIFSRGAGEGPQQGLLTIGQARNPGPLLIKAGLECGGDATSSSTISVLLNYDFDNNAPRYGLMVGRSPSRVVLVELAHSGSTSVPTLLKSTDLKEGTPKVLNMELWVDGRRVLLKAAGEEIFRGECRHELKGLWQVLVRATSQKPEANTEVYVRSMELFLPQKFPE